MKTIVNEIYIYIERAIATLWQAIVICGVHIQQGLYLIYKIEIKYARNVGNGRAACVQFPALKALLPASVWPNILRLTSISLGRVAFVKEAANET